MASECAEAEAASHPQNPQSLGSRPATCHCWWGDTGSHTGAAQLYYVASLHEGMIYWSHP